MPLAKCVRCKELFNKVDVPVCADCREVEETEQETVRKLLEEYPNLTAEEAAAMSGVDVECILRMLDAGRLTNTAMLSGVTCGRCGAPAISYSKKLCNHCLEKLNAEIAKAQSSIKLPDKRSTRIGPDVHNTRQVLDEKRRT